MSKCDVSIALDRMDRRFLPGEEITGTVHVQVNKNVKCDAVLLEHFWQTHGRGNKATGDKRTSVLHRGELHAGETWSSDFNLVAPNGPPTYHGHHLNVDHYLNARVDIPWAIDPKRMEEYVLLPGDHAWANLPKNVIGRERGMKQLSNAGIPIGIGLLVVGLFLMWPFGIVLIPAGLIVLFLSLRKLMAEKKLGSVKVDYGPLRVPPGGDLPLQIEFTPRRTTELNRITAKVTGEEKCVSGSGSRRTTHTHKLYQRTTVLMPDGNVTAGQRIQLKVAVSIPDMGTFTFSAKDNEIVWSVEVRIDIPLWPDWTEKRTLVVRPPVDATAVPIKAEPAVASLVPGRPPSPFADRMEAEIVPPAPAVEAVVEIGFSSALEEVAASHQPATDTQPLADTPPSVPAADTSLIESAPEPESAGASGDDFLAIVGQLVSARKYGPERGQILKDNAQKSFGCVLEIAKVERTYAYSSDKRFRNGRTVTGTISGTDCKAKLQLPKERNDEVDALDRGTQFSVDCLLLKWDNLYDRLEMRQV